MSTNMAPIMTWSSSAFEDKQRFRKHYPKFARKQSLVSNKPTLIFSSGRYNLDFCVRIQEGF